MQVIKIQNDIIRFRFLIFVVLLCPLFFTFSSLVEKVANESQKTPRDVVMMENFHHIFSTLSSLKISCLEAERKEAKQKYTEHLQSYVINSLGQPLEKLNVRQIFMNRAVFQYIHVHEEFSNETKNINEIGFFSLR